MKRLFNPGLIILVVYMLIWCCQPNRPSFQPVTSERYCEIEPVELKCEYRRNPLGIDILIPRLSWVVESTYRGQRQTAYEILVADSEKKLDQDQGNLWKSGKVSSNETIHMLYNGRPLKSGMCYYWKVRIWDKDGRMSNWSESARWETALLNPEDWKGQWIYDGKPTPIENEDFYKDDPAPLFRKEFNVLKEVKKARLYISGLGYYEAFINGRRVGDYVLDPGWTNYNKRILYSTYDVTDYLLKNQNCIGIILGNGWYNPLPLRMWGWLNLREHLHVGRPRFIAQLHIGYTDGSTEIFPTDKTWKTHDSGIIRNNIYLGEIYDARKEIDKWDQPGLIDTSWHESAIAPTPSGQFQAQSLPPLRITATIKPIQITEPKPGIYIVDFGQNFTGWIRLRLNGPAGTKVKLRYGELLYEDGTLNPMTSVCGQIKGKRENGNIGGPGSPEVAYQSDIYITKGKGEEIYVPRFTFHGFRYVEVTGYPGKPTLNSIEGLRINSDVNQVGSFVCSNDILNRIQEMVQWTFLSNMMSVQSDCPHRERFGYGGDIAVTSDAFIYNYDMATFYTKTVRDWSDAALSNGMLTDTAPFVGIHYCGVGWAMVHPLLLYQLYQYYGNYGILEEQYHTAKRWIDLISSQNKEHIIDEGLSDHESLVPTPEPQLVTPLYFQSVQLLSKLAALMGYTNETKKYRELSQEIKNTYVKKYLEPGTGKIDPFTQASQSFALYLDLVPTEEKSAALDSLIYKVLITQKGHLSTGIFGTKFLLDVLSRFGYAEVAYTTVFQKSFPGWGYMIDKNATTLWEHWEFSDNTYSHNHPMFGSVSEWFYKWIAGIQPDSNAIGFNRIVIKPQVAGDLTWVKSNYHSIRGNIKSEWNYEDGRFHLKVSIPANTIATVFIPTKSVSSITESGISANLAEEVQFLRVVNNSAIYKIGSGTYDFISNF